MAPRICRKLATRSTHRPLWLRVNRGSDRASHHWPKRLIRPDPVCRCSPLFPVWLRSKIMRLVSVATDFSANVCMLINDLPSQNTVPCETARYRRAAVRRVHWNNRGHRRQIRRMICTPGWRNSTTARPKSRRPPSIQWR